MRSASENLSLFPPKLERLVDVARIRAPNFTGNIGLAHTTRLVVSQLLPALPEHPPNLDRPVGILHDDEVSCLARRLPLGQCRSGHGLRVRRLERNQGG